MTFRSFWLAKCRNLGVNGSGPVTVKRPQFSTQPTPQKKKKIIWFLLRTDQSTTCNCMHIWKSWDHRDPPHYSEKKQRKSSTEAQNNKGTGEGDEDSRYQNMYIRHEESYTAMVWKGVMHGWNPYSMTSLVWIVLWQQLQIWFVSDASLLAFACCDFASFFNSSIQFFSITATLERECWWY